MTIKTGSQLYVFAPGEKVEILAESRATVFSVDDEDKPKALIASSVDGRLSFTSFDHFGALVKVPEGEHWSIEITPYEPFDKADPVPVEVPPDARKPETLEDKLRRFIGEMVGHQFGSDSAEMESLEDANFFGEDEDGPIPMSGYEVEEMDAVEPEPASDPPAEPAPGAPAEGGSDPEPVVSDVPDPGPPEGGEGVPTGS